MNHRSTVATSRALLLPILLLLPATSLQAAEFRSGDEIVIKADEVIQDDLYLFGNKVQMNGTVQGDLIVFAGQITVEGTIEQDLIAAGQTVLLRGSVGDDIRMAGQVLKLESPGNVGDDVIATGFSLEAEPGTTVGGDLLYAGYQAQLAGDIEGGVSCALANCQLSGAIGGDVALEVGSDDAAPPPSAFGPPPPVAFPMVPAGLTVDDTASIDGNLTYHSPSAGNIDDAAQIVGDVEHTRPVVAKHAAPTIAEQGAALARRFVCLAIVGICLLLIAPRWSERVSEEIKGQPLASLGLGLVGIIVFFILLGALAILTVVLAIVFGLLTLGDMIPVVLVVGLLGIVGLLGGFWLFTSYAAQVAVGLALSRFMIFRSDSRRLILPFLFGLVILSVLSNLPHIGVLVSLLIVVLGVGGLVLWMFHIRKINDSKTV